MGAKDATTLACTLIIARVLVLTGFKRVAYAEEGVTNDMVRLRDQLTIEHFRPDHVAPACVEELIRGLELACNQGRVRWADVSVGCWCQCWCWRVDWRSDRTQWWC